MSDDPREILQAAGVECAEVDAFYGPHSYGDEVDISVCFDEGDAAILALARLLAERDKALDDLYFFLKPGDTVTVRTPGKRGSVTFAMDGLADLRARAEEGSEDA